MFESRREAGSQLAKLLKKFGKDSLVLAIPRGGVVVAERIAKELKCPLDVIVTRKLGAPGNPELAIGATTSKGGLVLDKELIRKLGVSQDYIEVEHLRQTEEAKRREKLFSSHKVDLTGKTIVLVDDGIATGATAEAAIGAIREKAPKKIVVAIPVAPSSVVERLKNEADEVAVLSTPEPFYAIGQFYSSFPQVSDDEVVKILQGTHK